MTEHWLKTPLSEEDVKKLHAGDVVYLSGRVYTARDKAHALIRSRGSPVSLDGVALYHCGPLIRETKVLSAGPTTSGRMARYTEEILRLGVKAIIGKGGLPGEPFRGKAVYLAYPGGCGAAAARQLKVIGIHLQELGMAEALWEFEAENLGPTIVAIDSHGGDLYKDVRRSSSEPSERLRLRRAAEDVRYLLNRGYPKESSIRFVSDHYRLAEEQRFVLIRVVVGSETAKARRAKMLPLEHLRGRTVFVDGYNVLIAVESLLCGRPVYLGDDGFLRDTQGIFRSYKASEITDLALAEILDLLSSAAPARVEILLDQPISMSGRLAGLIREMMVERSLAGTARTVMDVDRQLKSAEGIIATADGNVIDVVPSVVDLPGEIARKRSVSPIVL